MYWGFPLSTENERDSGRKNEDEKGRGGRRAVVFTVPGTVAGPFGASIIAPATCSVLAIATCIQLDTEFFFVKADTSFVLLAAVVRTPRTRHSTHRRPLFAAHAGGFCRRGKDRDKHQNKDRDAHAFLGGYVMTDQVGVWRARIMQRKEKALE